MRVRVLEVIRQHFAAICREKKGLEQKEYAFPPGHPTAEPYPFEKLLEAERVGERDIWLGGTLGRVNVREWLDGITVPEDRSRLQEVIKKMEGKEGKQLNYLYIKNFGTLEVDMGEKNESRIDIKGDKIAASINSAAGNSNQQNQSTSILQNVSDPDLRRHLEELNDLIKQLRQKGADGDDCAVAEEAANALIAVAADPKKSDGKREAKGAMLKLKGLLDGFKDVVEVGEKFATVVKWLGPVIGGLIGSAI
jgi:hypothetical protein